jgi:hypothetical protein
MDTALLSPSLERLHSLRSWRTSPYPLMQANHQAITIAKRDVKLQLCKPCAKKPTGLCKLQYLDHKIKVTRKPSTIIPHISIVKPLKIEASKPETVKSSFPSVEELKIEDAFLSPSLDALRSFRTCPYPWVETKVYTDAMAMRDQKFKRYNARPKKVVDPYSPHCLDPQAEAAKSGAFGPHVVSVEDKRDFITWVWEMWWCQRNKWVDILIFVVTTLYFGIEVKVLKPVLTFPCRGYVAPVLLFLALLLQLII